MRRIAHTISPPSFVPLSRGARSSSRIGTSIRRWPTRARAEFSTPTEVRDLSLWATEGLLPDLTVLLDLDETAGRARLDEARTRYDRLESEADDFHARVRAGYLALAEAEPARFLVLDATLPVDELAARIRDRVSALLG